MVGGVGLEAFQLMVGQSFADQGDPEHQGRKSVLNRQARRRIAGGDEDAERQEGGGARLQGRPISASDTDDLEDAELLADARLMEAREWDEPWPSMRFSKRNALAYRLALVAAGANGPEIARSNDIAALFLVDTGEGLRAETTGGFDRLMM